MKLVELRIERLILDLTGESWALVLTAGGKQMTMSIGLLEGTAIDSALNQISSPRPLTADTALTAIRHLGADVSRVIIRDFRDGTFYATIEIRDSRGVVQDIDSRPSDAIAIAVRAKCPIFTTEKLLAEIAETEEEGRLTAKAMGTAGEKIGEA